MTPTQFVQKKSEEEYKKTLLTKRDLENIKSLCNFVENIFDRGETGFCLTGSFLVYRYTYYSCQTDLMENTKRLKAFQKKLKEELTKKYYDLGWFVKVSYTLDGDIFRDCQFNMYLIPQTKFRLFLKRHFWCYS